MIPLLDTIRISHFFGGRTCARKLNLSALCRAARTSIVTMCLMTMILLLPCPVDRSAYSYAQELDDGARDSRPTLQGELLWENVTHSSQWIGGVKPKRSLRFRKSVVTLAPGQSVDFLLPAHELVRVVSCDSGDEAVASVLNDVQIWASNGSGLYRRLNSAMSTDGRSIIAAPDQDGMSVAKVWRPDSASGSVSFTVYTSRRTAPKLLDFYQCEIRDCHERVQFTDDTNALPRDYNFLTAEQSKTLNVSGPQRLRFETRLKYGLDIQQRQTYWVKIYVDGSLDQVLSFDTLPERSSRNFINGKESVVGRREFAYLDVDYGDKRIDVECSHPTYMRIDAIGLNLCRTRINQAFSVPSWEGPEKSISNWDAPQFDPSSATLSRSFLSVDQSAPSVDPLWDPYLNQQLIQRLARDNRNAHGGLRAFMWSRALATRHYNDAEYGDELSVSDLANRMRERYTAYKNLLPERLNDSNELREVMFFNRSVRRASDDGREVTVGEQHVPDLLNRVARARLVSMDMVQSRRLDYVIPKKVEATMLRVVVEQNHLAQGSRVMVQYDDRSPIELVVNQTEAVSDRCLVPGSFEAAFAGLAAIHDRYDSGVAGGPFSVHGTPAPVIRAATAEFIKPADVERVSVWLVSETADPVYIGMQYLDAIPESLSETSFFALDAERVNSNDGDSHALRFAQYELNNNRHGLQTKIDARLERFVSSVQPSSQLEPSDEIWDLELISSKINKAKQLAGELNWPAAIDLLSQVIEHSTGGVRDNAIAARTNALHSAGEYFLADRDRRGWLLFGESVELKREMLNQLLLQAEDDEISREMFSVVAAVKNPGMGFDVELARQILNRGQYQNALFALGTLEATDDNLDILLRCSFQLNWWRLFDRTVKQIDDPEIVNFWQGLKELRLGRYERSIRRLEASGEQGKPWLKHWEAGHLIFEKLSASEPAERLGAIGEWESWLSSSPGPRQWQEERAIVKSCQGAATVWSTRGDMTGQFYRADAGMGATIEVHGPIRIQVEARPIHVGGSTEAIEDWLVIANENQLERVPIHTNYASQTLTIDDDPAIVPGAAVNVEIELPPGLNQLQVKSPGADILFRVSSSRPELALPILPPINETTIGAVVKGEFGRVTSPCNCPQGRCSAVVDDAECRDCVRLIGLGRNCRSIPLRFLSLRCGCGDLHSAIDYFNQLNFGESHQWQDRVLPQGIQFSIVGMDDKYRRAIYHTMAAESKQNGAATGIEDSSRMSDVVEVMRLAQENPVRADLQKLKTRVKSGATWDTFLQFDSRAGVHTTEIAGWQPEGPALRIRKSLMDPNAVNEHVITSRKSLQFQVNPDASPQFAMSLLRPQIGFIPLSPTYAQYTSPGKVQNVELIDSINPTNVQTNLVQGAAFFSIHHLNPTTNHFVAAKVREVAEDGSFVPIENAFLQSQPTTRTYQVATHEEPIRFAVAGPKVIRIDRIENDVTYSRIETISIDEEFELSADVDEPAYYRIFELAFEEKIPTYNPLLPKPEPQETWASDVVQAVYAEVDTTDEIENIDLVALRSPDLTPAAVELDDQGLLGLQELGTFGFEVGFRRRRAFDEFPVGDSEQFFDVKLTRNYFDAWRKRYTENELLVRPRIGSGPTFGFLHSGQQAIPNIGCSAEDAANGWGRYNASWNASVLSQHAGTPLLTSSSAAPWALNVSGRISRSHQINQFLRHQPTLGFFGRGLSEDENGFAPGELDQDIFTQYKSDHRYGFQYTDRFIYQSCLDRRWWIQPRLASNQDQLVPDNLGFRVGTDQLLGPVQLKLAYRLTGFFADNDRNQAAVQNILSLDMMYEKWHNRFRRSELRFSMRSDLGDGSTTVGFNLASFLNHARGYRDFSPNSMLFRSIREERAFRNNLINSPQP